MLVLFYIDVERQSRRQWTPEDGVSSKRYVTNILNWCLCFKWYDPEEDAEEETEEDAEETTEEDAEEDAEGDAEDGTEEDAEENLTTSNNVLL